MKRLAIHLALWALYAAVEFLANIPHTVDRGDLLRQTLFFIPVVALPFYVVAYYLVPKLLWRGHKTYFWICCLLILAFVLFIRLHWTSWYWTLMTGKTVTASLSKVTKNLIRDYAVIGFAVALKIIRDWDKKDRLTNQLQTEKRDAELQFLRAQIHPHFLFNTLNNLYGLALQQSPHTPDSILRLSGLLDFILYECNTDRIPLKKEIQLILDYIELEKLRIGDRLQLQFSVEDEGLNALIAPLLLLPLVENAFKHGARAANDAVFIKIDLRVQDQNLYFQVENSKPEDKQEAGNGSKGIGLLNIEKRLKLLYPGQYFMHKSNTASTFLISLKLNL
ncbi:MAG: histidine kinase [Lewinellaceae bacterium]|nr:histidine kinase [Saprospiraceae bacterium]MCB9316527.1 histidine kinase [Lewinellaceae bacterium]MCB9330485.1 histidine kinase [Lewinellaceae bacterium]